MNDSLKKYLRYFLILVYISGAIGYLITPSFFAPFTPLTLLFTCFVFLIHQPFTNLNYVFSFLAIAIIGYISEVLGVKTGLIFGTYHYGDALGYKILEVPIVISLNWALLINLGVLVASSFIKKPILLSIVATIIICFLDFLMEQVAASMHYWYFSEGIAGVHNYIGWFVISFATSYFFQHHLVKGNKKMALTILLLQVFFFGLINCNKIFNFGGS